MKKNIRAIIYALMLVCFIGCEANFEPPTYVPETPTTPELVESDIEVNAFSLVERQKEFLAETQLFSGGVIPEDDVRLRVRAYFYKNNEYVGVETGLYTNLSDDIVISKSNLTQNTQYNIVVLADFVIMTGNSVKLEFWKVQDHYDYSKIKIVDSGYTGLQYRSVGVAFASVRGGQNTSVTIEGLGMLAYMYFSNIDPNVLQNLDYYWSTTTEYLLKDRRAVASTTYVETYEVDSNYTGYYDYRYIIPNANNTCEFGWELSDISGNLYGEGQKVMQIAPSNNRMWKVDCTTNGFYDNVYNF